MVDIPFVGFAFPTSTGSTPRTMPARLDDIINVKEFGATGNGSTNDQPAIQNAIDAAFGPSTSPHAIANAHLNKTLFFPDGKYLLNNPLVFTRVYGGRIIGSGRAATTIFSGFPCWNINGMEECHFEGFRVSGNGGNCMELNWDGLGGTVQLRNKTFSDIFFDSIYGSSATCVRIGASGNGGSNNVFLNCYCINAAI
jgi:hypothetical protein